MKKYRIKCKKIYELWLIIILFWIQMTDKSTKITLRDLSNIKLNKDHDKD